MPSRIEGNIAMIIKTLSYASCVAVASCVMLVSAADEVSEKITTESREVKFDHEKALAELSARISEEMKSKKEWMYTDETGRPATRENLIYSLTKSFNAKGFSGEIFSALSVIDARGYKGDDIIDAIATCYNMAKSYFLKVRCIDTMFRLDEAKADAMARELWADQELGAGDPYDRLKDQLYLAEKLVYRNRKRLFAYPAIRQGLMTKVKHAARKAGEEAVMKKAEKVLELYRPYDGEAYNERGDKIDIEGLLAEAKAYWQKQAEEK